MREGDGGEKEKRGKGYRKESGTRNEGEREQGMEGEEGRGRAENHPSRLRSRRGWTRSVSNHRLHECS